ncbi:hypothetical protein HN51_039609 [Arachis hypogaea]|nr:uncharacterized protein DS421_16g535250 [Arachis hypogaea]
MFVAANLITSTLSPLKKSIAFARFKVDIVLLCSVSSAAIYSRSPPVQCVVQIGCSCMRVLPPSPPASVAGTTYHRFRSVLSTLRCPRLLLQIRCSILLTVLAFLS